MDIRLALMTGIDFPIPECQLVIHQPSLKEIAFIGEQDFFSGIQCITLNKSMFDQGKLGLQDVTNFQIFMTIMKEKESRDKRECVEKVLSLFFPTYKSIITPNSIIFMIGEDTIMVDQDNFEFLQKAFSDICCLKTGPQDQSAFNPEGKKAKEIAEKLMRGRQRVAEQNGTTNASVFSQYISILTIGPHSISLNDAIGLTMFQLYDLIERYSLYINWDIDIRARMAGAKVDGQPADWMKNIH